LLKVRGKPLMQWHLEALAQGGFDRVVINTAWLGDLIAKEFGDSFTLHSMPDKHKQLLKSERIHINYSHEGRDFGCALETAGGIVRALPMLGEVFWLLAGDVFAPDFIFSRDAVECFIQSGKLAHLWLVPNPEHNPRGDFGLTPCQDDGPAKALNLAPEDATHRYTYSTIGLYRRKLFEAPWCDIPAGNPAGVKAALAPLLRLAMNQQQVSAELFEGAWTDVGTPQRLAQLNEIITVITPF
jgi:MurNAc alpha-1-phosphate uridylyltransferase